MILYIIVACFSFYLFYRTFLTPDPLPTVPGPKGIPMFGNALQISGKKPYLLMADWAKKYGGVYKLNIMGMSLTCN